MADIYDILPTFRPGLEVCAGESLSPGTAREASLTLAGEEQPVSVIVVRLESGEPRAFLNRCTHFGLPLNARPDYGFIEHSDGQMVLRCQHHFMDFLAENGEGASFECRGESLTVLPITEQNGQILTA